MASQERARCPENDALVEHMRTWWDKLIQEKKYSPNLENNIKRAFTNVCAHKTPITSLKQLHEIKGVGKWIVKEMREFFKTDTVASENDNSPTKGKKGRGTRRYVPQKNSAAYALLIALYRSETDGITWMRKQELIDAAEASGLSRAPIGPEKGKGKQGLGSSSKEWYSGWSSMGKLIDKCLVEKSSCPAKYKLSDEGRRVAVECLSRSGMLDSTQSPVSREECSDSDKQDNVVSVAVDPIQEVRPMSVDLTANKGARNDIPEEFFERFTRFSYSREQVLRALADISLSSSDQDISTLWPAVLCRLREDEVYGTRSDPPVTERRSSGGASTSQKIVQGQQRLTCVDNHVEKTVRACSRISQFGIRMPPLGYLEKFGDAYKVVLVLDDREHFVRSKSRSIIENIGKEFKIEIKVRRLPVGDAIWIARHKQLHTEYVLDFIVERKKVDDLRSSIRDNRYRDQKLRLLRTGIKKIIYVVEGDPNACEGADCIKTACFTTEILEGFDVQRTSGLGDTVRRYGFLTQAINNLYELNSSLSDHGTAGDCLQYDRFIKKCGDVDKLTVSDVFATQLVQVSQVTEEVAVAVVDCFPTLYSLASAYAVLDGDTHAQEELLFKQSKGVVNAAASRNIYRFIWAN